MKKRIGVIAAVGAAVALAASGGGYALAANASAPAVSIPAGTLHGCVSGSTRVLEHVFESNASGTTCPSGSFLVYWGVTGPKGAPGPSGVVPTAKERLAPPLPPIIETGGSFTARKTLVGTVTLAAGA